MRRLGGWSVAASLVAAAGVVVAGSLSLAGERGHLAVREVQRNRDSPPEAAAKPMHAGRLELPIRASTPKEVRAVVHACRDASTADVAELQAAALESPDPLVVANAVRALGRLGAFASDERLRALLDDPRPRVRQEAVLAVGSSGGSGAVELLLERLRSAEPGAAPLVLAALGELGDTRARDAVARAATDPGRTTVERAFARSALRHLEPTRAR